MRHFFTNKIKAVLVIAVLLAAGLGVLGALTGTTPADMVVKGLLTPLRGAASTFTDFAQRYYDYMFRYEALESENEALKKENAQIRQDIRDIESIRRENERLRQLLQLTQSNPDYTLVDGYIIARSSGDWSSQLTVNRGTSSGVEEGMCAITANGEVVGLVIEAGINYCVLKTVLDSTLEISSTIASSGYSGITRGGYTEGQLGKLRMDYLPSSAVIRNNDQVVTSGTTVYPRNLILGYIIDAGFSDTGVAKFAVLRPAADLDSLEQVFILTDFDLG